jgi:hypothetical protein
MISSYRMEPLPESQIRLRLFNRLGIHKTEPTISADMEQFREHALRNSSICVAQRNIVPFCQPLKDILKDYGADDGNSNDFNTPPSTFATLSQAKLDDSCLDQNQELPQQQHRQKHQHDHEDEEISDRSYRRRIQFNKNVMVVPIPSRHAYSKRIKQAFWMDGAEIQATAERNRYEFASEGWDFHQVLDDDDMYVNTATGQLVHPCWVEDEEYEDEDDLNPDIEESGVLDDSWKREEQCSEVTASALRRTNSGHDYADAQEM